jgi:uncharacterized protein YbjT (DUF2867 family)
VPVVVTGASGPVGRALVPRLVAAGSEVRAVVRRQAAAESLRALGAKVAVGDAANPELLPTVLRDAHTLCHVVDGLFLEEDQYFSVIAGTTQATVEAAKEAELARVLFLSYPGADPGSPNAYLRAKGMAEQAVRESGLEHLIVRSALVLGRESPWLFLFGAWSTRLPLTPLIGPGTQRVAPVFVDDVAAVLAAADDRVRPVSGTFGLQGPDTMTADQLADLLAGRKRQKVHLSVDRAVRVVGISRKRRISRAAAEVLASDSLADAPDAAAEFGVKLTPLKEALGASGLSPV